MRKVTTAGEVTSFSIGVSSPNGITLDGNSNLFASGGNRIYKSTLDGLNTVFAGQLAQGNLDGVGTAATFTSPTALAVANNGNLFVSELFGSTGQGRIRMITPDATVSSYTYLGIDFAPIESFAIDVSGNIYFGNSNTIRKLSVTRVITTVAGQAGVLGSANGTGSAARFNNSIRGMTFDALGNLYVADTDNSTIRMISPMGVVTTIAGQPLVNAAADGVGTNALFGRPGGIFMDKHWRLFVCDMINKTIRVGYPLLPPVIITSPTNVTVSMGASAVFTVTATSVSPLNFQWRRNGSPLSGATNAMLTLNGVQLAQAGDYDVVVSNAGGSTNTAPPAVLVVTPPPVITTSPVGQSFTLGQGIALNVAASGTEPFFYQWQFNGTNLAGATNATLSLTNLTVATAGIYRVLVSNAAGSTISDVARLNFVGLNLFPVLTIADVVGSNYRIEATSDLVNTNSWTTLTNLVLPSNPYLFIDTSTPQAVRRYYRAIALP